MIIYHALWDGLLYGLIPWSVALDAAMQRAAQIIAGSFLVIVGVSMALAQAQADTPLIKRHSFWKRFAVVALAAAAVSVATRFALPQAPIYFGILHHIALVSIALALVAPFHPFLAAALAAGAVILAQTLALEGFNHPALIWLGLGTHTPVTADWVPIFPWIAAPLLGFALAKHLLVDWLASRAPQGEVVTKGGLLTWLGQHSLAVYLIHQPVLIGLILGFQWLQ